MSTFTQDVELSKARAEIARLQALVDPSCPVNVYETEHVAMCPNGVLKDHYHIVIKSSHTIQVEHLLKVLDDLPKTIYQEDLADALRAKLGASVTVTGWHFSVKIVCHRP